MSNFNCEKCGLPILEDENGSYYTACPHYPVEELSKHSRGIIYVDATYFIIPTIEIKVKP
jgi:hypothetical protein